MSTNTAQTSLPLVLLSCDREINSTSTKEKSSGSYLLLLPFSEGVYGLDYDKRYNNKEPLCARFLVNLSPSLNQGTQGTYSSNFEQLTNLPYSCYSHSL
jgi:hypothetical protein